MFDKLRQNIGIAAESSNDPGSAARLKEMVAVLRKHDIVLGITPVKLRMILEDLGPLFVKWGQVMSMRPDFLPTEYCEELTKLQSDVKPLPFKTVISVIEEEYNCRIGKVFALVEETPLGAASIAQVHKARLVVGDDVVIKVQRPGIYPVMSRDITLLKRAAGLLKVISRSQDVVDFNLVLDEMWTIAKQEMDFMVEADHIEEFHRLNHDAGVSCPSVYRSLTTRQILVMEYIDGFPIDDFERVKAAGIDITVLGRRLGENYVKQIIEDGYFHADPHPGNIWIKNGRIVWLDLGMMGRLGSRDRAAIRKAIFALANRDTFEMKAAVLTLGQAKGPVNHTALYQDIESLMEQYDGADFSSIKMGVLTHQILNLLRVHRISCPQGLSMFARGVMTVEGVMRLCCPKVSFVDIFVRSMSLEFKRNFKWRDELDKAKREMYLLVRRSVQLPEQLSNIIKMTMSGQTKVNLDVTGTEDTLRKLDNMVNRLVIAVLCAALLLGSSTVCTTNMTPKFMEIPFLGIVGYMLAFILSLKIIWDIYMKK